MRVKAEEEGLPRRPEFICNTCQHYLEAFPSSFPSTCCHCPNPAENHKWARGAEWCGLERLVFWDSAEPRKSETSGRDGEERVWNNQHGPVTNRESLVQKGHFSLGQRNYRNSWAVIQRQFWWKGKRVKRALTWWPYSQESQCRGYLLGGKKTGRSGHVRRLEEIWNYLVRNLVGSQLGMGKELLSCTEGNWIFHMMTVFLFQCLSKY